MAWFRECLSARALEAIRGLGVSEAEYEGRKKLLVLSSVDSDDS